MDIAPKMRTFMNSIHFDYKNTCQMSDSELEKAASKLLPEIDRISAARSSSYISEYASINLSFDQELCKTMLATVKEKKSLQPTALVVLGIGGSNLGTIA